MNSLIGGSDIFLANGDPSQSSPGPRDKTLGSIKRARRQVQVDAITLSNRITLLKQEEIKAIKKVQETKRKTHEVYLVKQRNEERYREKEMNREIREQSMKATVIASAELREQKRINRQNILDELRESKHRDMLAIRIQRDYNNALKQDFLRQVIQRNTSKSRVVKNHEVTVLRKNEEFMRQKLNQIRLEKDKMYAEEEAEKRNNEALVSELEKMEMNLVKKLQTTQIMQKTASEQLKSALVLPVGANTTRYSHTRTASMGMTLNSTVRKDVTFEAGAISARNERDNSYEQ